MKMKFVSKLFICLSLLMYLLVYVVSDFETYTVFVMEGDSVTLKHSSITATEEDWVTWRIKNLVAQRKGYFRDIKGYFRDICADVQCKDRNKRLIDRLKLNPDGSLTITNATITDSGDYWLLIESFGSDFGFYSVVVRGFFSFDSDGVSVMEGDSVTLNTGDQMKQEEIIKWYFNNTAIVRIFGDLRYSCTDVQCYEDTERFRDRLKLHNTTGSLTITDTRTTDSGLYDVLIKSHRSRSSRTKIFLVAVHGVSAAERDEMKKKSVKEGESVTLDTREIKNPNNSMTWYFNDTLIAEITGDQSKICTGVQCEGADERFRDRLKLDHQTGSLTIRDIRTTDSGDYKLQISSSRFSIIRSFSVTVNL